MPKYRVKAPTGETYEITAPEGATQDQIMAYVQQNAPHSRISPQDAAAMSHGTEQGPPRSAQAIDKLEAAIKGNAAEDLPSVASDEFAQAAGWGLTGGLRPGLASSFGSDKDLAQAVLKSAPGSTLTADANGNPVIQLKDGKRFYVNKPGLDVSDTERALIKGASFIPAARLASVPASVLARATAGAALAGGTDAAMQLGGSSAAGNPSLDLGQTAVATGLGGGSELAPALIAGASRGLARLATTDAKAAAIGQRVAKAAGYEGKLTDADLIELGRRYPEIKAGANPDAALAEAEFGFKLTRGQKTGDLAQLRREEMLRNMGNETMASRSASRVYDTQQQNVQEQARKIQDYLAKGKAPESPTEATEAVIGGVQKQAEDLSDKISAAYNDARAQSASVSLAAVSKLPQVLRQSVNEFDIHPDLTPATSRILDSVQEQIGNLPPNASGVTMRAIETQRKRINNALQGLQGADRAALTRVKGAYDKWVDDAFDNALISGDSKALETLKQARSLRAEYGSRFQPKNANDQGGKIVQRLVSEDATPDQMAQVIFGAGQLAPAAAISVVRKLKSALGNDAESWNAVRAAFVNKAVTNRAGETMGPQAIVGNLNRLMRERPELVNQLYTPDELAKLDRFGKAMAVLIPPKDIAKSSGTTERALAYFTELLSNIPGGKAMIDLLQAPGRAATASRMMAPVRSPTPTIYRAGVLVPGNLQNQPDSPSLMQLLAQPQVVTDSQREQAKP